MKSNSSQLAKELRKVGASEAEIQALLPVASSLSQIREDQDLPAASDSDSVRWVSVLKPVVFSLSGLVIGAVLIVVSQTASPTSPLYPLQKFSDTVAIRMHPQYRAIVMMKRAQQVNQLVAAHANSAQILATLNDYTTEANTYRSSPHANYAAFDFCETALQQAASAAPLKVREAITASLQSLDTT